jgi:hypothetical protein
LVEGDLVDDLGTVLPGLATARQPTCESRKRIIGRVSYFLNALISSIFSGRSSAKRSFRVCSQVARSMDDVRLQVVMRIVLYLALGGVASGGREGSVPVDERGCLQRGPQGGGR